MRTTAARRELEVLDDAANNMVVSFKYLVNIWDDGFRHRWPEGKSWGRPPKLSLSLEKCI